MTYEEEELEFKKLMFKVKVLKKARRGRLTYNEIGRDDYFESKRPKKIKQLNIVVWDQISTEANQIIENLVKEEIIFAIKEDAIPYVETGITLDLPLADKLEIQSKEAWLPVSYWHKNHPCAKVLIKNKINIY